MKRFGYLSALASWLFFAVMGYFAVNTLENGFLAFWIGQTASPSLPVA